jgi:hypothetical protein
MLAAVDFDNNFQPMAGEVGKVWPDRSLTPKVKLPEGLLPQMLPKLSFGVSRVATERASARHAFVNGPLLVMRHPPPPPTPPRHAHCAWEEGRKQAPG